MNPRPRKLHLLKLLPRGWVVIAGPETEHTLYLTFDDGPHAVHTPLLLDLLWLHGVRATFFLIGDRVGAQAPLVQRIVDEGHTLGNHSFSHPQFETLSLREQLDEIELTDRLLSRFDGAACHGFRPPRGVLPPRLLWHFVRNRRHIDHWSYDTLDYGRGDASALIELARQQPPRGGDILLMHDDGPASLEMLKLLIPEWKAQGFKLDALPREPGAKPVHGVPGAGT